MHVCVKLSLSVCLTDRVLTTQVYSLLVKSRVTSKCLLPLCALPVFVAAIAPLTFTSTLLLPHLSRETAVSDLPVQTFNAEMFFFGGGGFISLVFLKGFGKNHSCGFCKALWNVWVMCDENKLDFYRIAPAMLRQASYGTIKIGTYQTFKRLLVERPEGESQFLALYLSPTHTVVHTHSGRLWPAPIDTCTFLFKGRCRCACWPILTSPINLLHCELVVTFKRCSGENAIDCLLRGIKCCLLTVTVCLPLFSSCRWDTAD